jgi:hypothetical protein
LLIDFNIVKQEFENKRWTLMSNELDYHNVLSRLKVVCPHGHETTANYHNNIKLNEGCYFCFKERYFLSPIEKFYHRKRRWITKKYRQWRKQVFERDKYTCQVCGQVGGNLAAHHLDNYAKFKKLRYIVSNGICLCANCHKQFHVMYGMRNVIKEQFENFMLKGVC